MHAHNYISMSVCIFMCRYMPKQRLDYQYYRPPIRDKAIIGEYNYISMQYISVKVLVD